MALCYLEQVIIIIEVVILLDYLVNNPSDKQA